MRFSKLVYVIYLLGLLHTHEAFANATFKDLNARAIAAYEAGQYQDAINHWKALSASGNTDPDIFYNIANAVSMLGNISNALLFYEKAYRYKPGSSEIKEAIRKERNKIVESVSPVPPFFLEEWFRVLLSVMRPGAWAFIGLLVLLAGVFKWLTTMNLFRHRLKLPGRLWMYAVCGSILMMMAAFSYQSIHKKNEGIIFSDCEVRQGPSEQSPQLRILYSGEKVRIKDKITGWYRVTLLNLDEGWLKEEGVRVIDVNEQLNN